MTTKMASQQLHVDFPQEGDVVFQGHYAVRLTVSAVGQTEVAINKGPWQVCRPDSGFQWYDWWPEKTGRTEIEARLIQPDGKIRHSENRTCTVKRIEQN